MRQHIAGMERHFVRRDVERAARDDRGERGHKPEPTRTAARSVRTDAILIGLNVGVADAAGLGEENRRGQQ